MSSLYNNLVTRKGRPGKCKADYGVPDMFEYYTKQVGPVAGLKKAKYGEFIRDLNIEIGNAIFNKAQTIHLPCHCGRLSIQKYRQKFNKKKLRVDWAKSKELGKRMYHLNEHRDGFKYFFRWDKEYRTPNITAYSFLACRAMWRRLSSILKNDMDKDYQEMIFASASKKRRNFNTNKPSNESSVTS